MSVPTLVNAGPGEEGKTIFNSRCASCHNVNKVVVGPALAGVDERRSIDWIVNFVKSSQSVVKSGDKDAVAIFEKFNKVPMPDHSDLSTESIKNIVAYIKGETKLAVTDKKSTDNSNPGSGNMAFSITKNYFAFTGFLAAVLLLIGTLIFAVKVASLKKQFYQSMKKVPNSPVN